MNLWENLSKYFMVTLVVLNLCILIGTSAVLGAFVRRGYGERKQSLSIDREYPEKLLYDDAVPLLSLPQVANLKPPSYRHKILQFSNEKMLNQPASSLGKLLLEYKTGCVALPQDYLVAGKLGNVYNSQLIASSITGNLGVRKCTV